jgi:transcriptional regulator with XRE-family HTH domain
MRKNSTIRHARRVDLAANGEPVPDWITQAILEGVSPVRAYRVWRDLTSTELARKAGLSTSTVSCIERGTIGGSRKSLEALADALGVGVDRIAR